MLLILNFERLSDYSDVILIARHRWQLSIFCICLISVFSQFFRYFQISCSSTINETQGLHKPILLNKTSSHKKSLIFIMMAPIYSIYNRLQEVLWVSLCWRLYHAADPFRNQSMMYRNRLYYLVSVTVIYLQLKRKLSLLSFLLIYGTVYRPLILITNIFVNFKFHFLYCRESIIIIRLFVYLYSSTQHILQATLSCVLTLCFPCLLRFLFQKHVNALRSCRLKTCRVFEPTVIDRQSGENTFTRRNSTALSLGENADSGCGCRQ